MHIHVSWETIQLSPVADGIVLDCWVKGAQSSTLICLEIAEAEQLVRDLPDVIAKCRRLGEQESSDSPHSA
jgi:hypothetical protein